MANIIVFAILAAVIIVAALASVFTTRIMRAVTALLFVLFAVPRFGLSGYVPGLLISQMFLVVAALSLLHTSLQQSLLSWPELFLPLLLGLIAVGAMWLLHSLIPWLGACSWGSLLVSTGLLLVIFASLALCGYLPVAKATFQNPSL